MIILYILICCILTLFLVVAVVGVYDGYHGINRFKTDIQPIIDTETENTIEHLKQLKSDYIKLYKQLETEYNNGSIKPMQYQNKKISIDKQIYTIDTKLNKLYNSLE